VGNILQTELAKNWAGQGLTPDVVRLTGPMPAVLSKLKGQHRVHVVISAQRDLHPSRLVPQEVLQMRELQGMIRVDVDPFSYL
jgi:primosomal protein N'